MADAVQARHGQDDATDKNLLWPRQTTPARGHRAAEGVPADADLLHVKAWAGDESLHVALCHNETHQNFTTWVYAERDQLMLGSGLFVGETGVAANHHFLAPYDSKYQFTEGQYRLDVVARLHGERDAKLLFSQELTISREVAVALAEPGTGLYFEWGPDAKRYLPYVDKRPPLPDPEDFIGVLALRPSKD